MVLVSSNIHCISYLRPYTYYKLFVFYIQPQSWSLHQTTSVFDTTTDVTPSIRRSHPTIWASQILTSQLHWEHLRLHLSQLFQFVLQLLVLLDVLLFFLMLILALIAIYLKGPPVLLLIHYCVWLISQQLLGMVELEAPGDLSSSVVFLYTITASYKLWKAVWWGSYDIRTTYNHICTPYLTSVVRIHSVHAYKCIHYALHDCFPLLMSWFYGMNRHQNFQCIDSYILIKCR